MLTLILLVGLLTALGIGQIVSNAQSGDLTCPALVDQALDALEGNCTGTDRNSACYGYDLVRASFFDEVDESYFTLPADMTSLTSLQTLSTASLDLESGHWGISLINAQANVPNTLPGQAVTFLLLGDTQVENAVEPADALEPVEPVTIRVTSSSGVNIRSGPGTNFNRIGVTPGGYELQADGRNEAGDWLRISLDDEPGWIFRDLTTTDDPALLDALPILSEKVFTPMQAFYFTTGIGQSACNEAPDTLVIQGPKELTVNLEINGAEITIGSTIALTSHDPDDDEDGASDPNGEGCRLNELIVLDGEAMLNDGRLKIPLGYRALSETCFDDDGNVETPPDWENDGEVPQDELHERFGTLEKIPESVLRYPIHIPTEDEIDKATRRPTPPPTNNTGNTGNTVPAEQTPEVVVSDCGEFAGVSPTEGMAFGPQAFYWNPAPGAEFYRVIVQSTDRGTQVFADSGGPTQTLTLDLGVGALRQFGRGYNFQWFVQAYAGGQLICQTQPIFQLRQSISDPELCKLLGGQWDGACYGRSSEWDTNGDGILELPN